MDVGQAVTRSLKLQRVRDHIRLFGTVCGECSGQGGHHENIDWSSGGGDWVPCRVCQ